MASQVGNDKALRLDPENRLLWRMNRRRLEGEALWDSIHEVAGTLNAKMGGPPVAPPLTADEMTALGEKSHWPVSADPAQHTRRGIYILLRRNFAFPMFEAFDEPYNAVSCPKREVTTVAPQALWTLNNRTALQQAMEFAARLVRAEGDNPPAWVERGWNLALARPAGSVARCNGDLCGEPTGAKARSFPCQGQERYFHFHARRNEPRRHVRSQT